MPTQENDEIASLL